MKKKGRSRSSGRWLAERHRDEFVKRAHDEGQRSRAVFKLKEINERDRLFRKGMTVVDIGAAPGGWSEYIVQQVGAGSKVIALDLRPMDNVPGVTFIQGDFRDTKSMEQLKAALAGKNPDIVLSDMSPDLSGMRVTDQARAMDLAELALYAAKDQLARGGDFLVKLFQGSGFVEFRKEVQEHFDRVIFRKPNASRARSREIYLLARGFKSCK